MSARRLEELFFKGLMLAACLAVLGSLVGVVGIVLVKGLPVFHLRMLFQGSAGGSSLGQEGGILNAIIGSLLLGLGGTLGALVLALPIVSFLQRDYGGRRLLGRFTRLGLDVLWGIPSIVYGAFVFALMLVLGMRASLLAGIVVLTLVELPIMARAMDEVMRLVPPELKEASYSLGANRLETTRRVVWRQCLPGFITAMLLAFGRGIGDAAAVLLTAGYSEYLPRSIMDSVASLPIAVYVQYNSPFPEVQQRAYASATVLLIIVLLVSVVSRLAAARAARHVVR
jgi:phosphate transport system permease protein